MQKKRNIILIIAIVILIIPIYLYSKPLDYNKVLENNYNEKSDNKTLSLMYETSAGSGEYVVSNDTAWPNEEYIFNETKSKCVNGSEPIWNEEDKTILIETNFSDRCYVYFDKKATIASTCQGQNLASCIAQNYTLDSSIIHHDGTMKDATYGTIDAEDNSYRYSGPSEKVNNFVCFGSDAETCPNENLYRIIGVFNETNIKTGKQEKRVKLIKYDYALTNLLGTDGEYKEMYEHATDYYKGSTDLVNIPEYYYNKSDESLNNWIMSKLNTVNLNTNYINSIGVNWANKIAETIWKIGGMTGTQGTEPPNIAKNAYDYELGLNSINKTHQAKIGLMYMSDYYYAADSMYWTYQGYDSNDSTKDFRAATGNNWIYMGLHEWLISPLTDYLAFAFYVNITGLGGGSNVYNDALAVRPSFYLVSSTVLSGGSGSMRNPYRIS